MNSFAKTKSLIILALAGVIACGVLSAQQLQLRSRYKLLPGDQIAVHFPLTPEFDQQVALEPDGYVVLNAGGEAKLGGLTLADATEVIKKQASIRLNNPEVHLVLMDFQHPYFVVAGEVNSPNRYDLREDITALQAVMMAGGIRISGKQEQVLLVHGAASGSPTVRQLNMKHLNSKSVSENPIIASGDIVFVPRNRITNLQQWTSIITPFAGYASPAANIAATVH